MLRAQRYKQPEKCSTWENQSQNVSSWATNQWGSKIKNPLQ